MENQVSFISFIQPMFIDDVTCDTSYWSKKKIKDMVCLSEVKVNLR